MRYRAIIALLLITQLMCLGCGSSITSKLFDTPAWSDDMVNEYFDKQSDIIGLMAQLKPDGYKYVAIRFVS